MGLQPFGPCRYGTYLQVVPMSLLLGLCLYFIGTWTHWTKVEFDDLEKMHLDFEVSLDAYRRARESDLG